jgi:IclR family pca regulon transcriptional regulator
VYAQFRRLVRISRGGYIANGVNNERTVALEKRDFAQTLARGLVCLEVLSNTVSPIGCSEVAATMGVSRAAARRILLTLQHLGYVTEHQGRYASAPKVLSLGRSVLGEGTLWSKVAPEVVGLADRFNEPCSISVLDGLEIVFVCRDATRRIFTSRLGVGDRLPAHCSASGKVLLASLPERDLTERLKGVSLDRHGPSAITGHRQLLAALRGVRTDGYALAVDEMEDGTLSIAVPIRERQGRTIAAMSLASHRSRMAPNALTKQVLGELRAATARIERTVGDFQDRGKIAF